MSPRHDDDLDTRIDEWVAHALEDAPPLTVEQRARLMPLFREAHQRVLADREQSAAS